MSSTSPVIDHPSGSDLNRANDLQRRAVQANVEGHPRRAEQLVRRGLDLLDAGPEHDRSTCEPERCRTTSRLLATLAKSEVEIRGLDRALTVMDESLRWASCVQDDSLTASLISQRALILFRGGRLADAETAFGQALARLPESGVDLVRLLLNRGALFVEMGQIPLARVDLVRATRCAEVIADGYARRIALHNLGCLEFTAGDLPRALQLMHDGIELDGDTQQGIAHLDRARVLLAAGLPDEADDALRQAAELFRRDRCWQDLGEVDLTRAEVALLTGRVTDTRRLAARARDRFRRHGNDRWRRAAELVLLQADQAAGRPAGRLLPPARRLAAEFAEAGQTTQASSATLLAAELELELGRADEADRMLTRAGRLRPSDPIAVRLHSHLVRAEILERRAERPAARRVLRRGLEDLAAYQAQFGGIDLQSASAVHGRRLAQRDLELALGSGRAGSVIAAVERSRAVSGRITPVTPPADPRTAELLAELRRVVEVPEPARQQMAELQSELRARSWLSSGSRAWHPPASVAELRAAAALDDCHLVTVTELHGRLSAVTIPPSGSPKLVELADGGTVRGWQHRLSADLDLLANAALPAAMRMAATRSLRRGAADLSRLLAAALPQDDRSVVISPAGELLALPWPLLPQLQRRPVCVTPSLSGWHRARAGLVGARSEPSTPWSVTAVAGPGLPRAREETAAVAEAWAGCADTYDRPTATSAEVLEAMSTSRLVHIATHGVHHGQNPMFSSLSLAGGPLFAYDVDRRGHVPEHVVLSACDVGRSTVRAGQETLGLTSVLLQLGCGTVVAGVARVHDDSAAEIMQHYHAELAGGRGAAEALCSASDQVDAFSPFVCFGAAWQAPA